MTDTLSTQAPALAYRARKLARATAMARVSRLAKARGDHARAADTYRRAAQLRAAAGRVVIPA